MSRAARSDETPRPRRGRWRSVAGWVLGVGSLVAGWLWVLGGRVYWVDVLVSYQSLIVAAVTAALAGCLALRRFRAAGLGVLGLVVGGWPLVAGRPVLVPPVDLSSPPGAGVVRVVSFNINPLSERWASDLDLVLGWHADAVVLLEVPVDLNRGVRRLGLLEGTGWAWEHRAWVDEIASPCFVLSRHPMERVVVEGVAEAERDILLVRVETGAGPVLVGAVHPHSPRTRERWAIGNETVSRTVPGMVGLAGRDGLPLAIGADLNAGPAGSRAGVMRGSGLSMSKPLATGWWGSFPGAWPGPARVQLDDVWASGGFDVVAWSSVASAGSDHRIIVADLRSTRAQPGR